MMKGYNHILNICSHVQRRNTININPLAGSWVLLVRNINSGIARRPSLCPSPCRGGRLRCTRLLSNSASSSSSSSSSNCNVYKSDNSSSANKKNVEGGKDSVESLHEELKQREQIDQKLLLQEASFLTRSLFRLCLRSVQVIRPGNENDEKEFKRLEERRLKRISTGDPGSIGIMSMLPPVDRGDELRSRAEYYTEYARENIVQEKESLPTNRLWHEQNIDRFVQLLRKGNNDRKWLLKDMKFEDNAQKSKSTALNEDTINKFYEIAMEHVEENNKIESKIRKLEYQKVGMLGAGDYCDDDNDDDDENDDQKRRQQQRREENENDEFNQDEDDEEFPPWFREQFPHLVNKFPSSK